MSKGLRSEDYVAYLDESGEDSIQVVSGVLIPARWLRAAERRWRDFIRDHLGSRSGRREVKSRELIRGEGVSLHAQSRILAGGGAPLSARAAGRQFYRDALEHIATINEIKVLTVGLATRHPEDVYRLWYWMAYALLVQRPRAPRPRLPLIVIDGEDAAFRAAQDLIAYRFYRAFPRCQPYVSRGDEWFVGGSIHQNSELHPFIQMADLVAGVARHSIVGRAPFSSWYRDHLVDYARRTRTGRAIDVSGRAIDCLKTLSPNDGCGSGWSRARIAT
jgi:hypothetical protein